MKRRLLSIVLAASLIIPAMPVMASEVQELPVNVVEVQEETEELAEEIVELTELEGAPEFVEEEQEVVEEPAIEEEQEVVEEPVIEEEQEVIEEPAIEEEQEVVEEPAIEKEQEVVEEPAIEEEQEVVEEPAIEEEQEVVEEPVIEEEQENVAEAVEDVSAVEEIIEEEITVLEEEDEVLGAEISFEEGKDIAESVAVDNLREGNISVSKEDDWYKFTTVDYTSYYTFTLNNLNAVGGYYGRVYLTVYDNLGVEIISTGGVKTGNSVSINAKLDKNTEYYVLLDAEQGCTGDYSFKYTVATDEADVKEEAREIAADTLYESGICVSREDDWYKVKTEDYTSYYTFTLNNLNASGGYYGRVYLTVYNNVGAEIISTGGIKPGNTSTIDVKLDKNTEYYVLLDAEKECTGDYSFKYTVTEDEPDIKEEAKKIAVDTLYESSICTSGDDDWYKIKTVDYTSCYTFTLNNVSASGGWNSYVYLTVYDKTGAKIVSTGGVKTENSVSINVKLDKKAEYYVLLDAQSNCIGNYSFKYTVTLDEPDTKEEATQNLIEGIMNRATICVSGDVDWYKLTTKNIDLEYEFSITNENVSGVELILYDKTGAKIKGSGTAYSEGKKSFTEELKKNTTYYLKVSRTSSGSSTGSYNFTVTPITDWPFIDVAQNPGNWKYEAVKYVYENGIMTGTKPNEFQPDAPLTRAMFATMLYRMAGQPAVTYTSKYPDVPEGKWFSNAVIWASQKGIVNGYGDGRFGTNDYITREQIAKMLMEYGRAQGYNVGQSANFNNFADAGSVSGWANNYMKWAVGSGMISGSQKNGKYYLNPKGNATRAESATMLKRFMEKYV